MRARPAVTVAAAAVVVLLAAGCSGGSAGASGSAGSTPGASASSSLAGLPASEILSRARAAALAAGSVHVTGTQGDVALDLRIGPGVATGTVREGDLTAQVLRVGGRTYVKGDQAFWEGTAGPGTGAVLAGKWVVAGTGVAGTSGLAALTNLPQLLDLVLAQQGALSVTGTSTVDGQRVVGVRDDGSGAVLWVAADGPPYPVAIDVPGQTAPPPRFTDWGHPVVVPTPPADQVVDPSRLGG